jgi:hypothetical protein
VNRLILSSRGRWRTAGVATAVLVAVAGVAAVAPHSAKAAAACQQSFTGVVRAYQSASGHLVMQSSSAGVGSIGVAAAGGTSPAIAAMPCGNTDGIDQIAFHGADDHFWQTTQAGAVNSWIAIMPGTSPSQIEMPGNQSTAVFTGYNGDLYAYSTLGPAHDLGEKIARCVNDYYYPPVASACTSPSVGYNTATGLIQTAWQGPDNALWVSSFDGPVDTHYPMAAGASPVLSEGDGGAYEVVFQASDGNMAAFDDHQGSNGDNFKYWDFGLPMVPGTKPAIARQPNTAGWFAYAWVGTNGHLWQTSAHGPLDLKLPVEPGTSPSMAYLPSGGDEIDYTGSDGTVYAYQTATGTTIAIGAAAPGTSPSVTTLPVS